MSFEVQVSAAGGIAVLRCRGRLVLGQGAALLREVGRRMFSDGCAVALDLGGVTEMDAHGAGVLAALCAEALGAGMPLTLARAGDRVQRLLRLTRLDAVMSTLNDAADAGSRHRISVTGSAYDHSHLTTALAAECSPR